MNKNAIIVGNGLSALKKEKGKEIDKFDFIYRFYPYELGKYEKYVGKKTSHLIVKKKHHRKIAEGVETKEIKEASKFINNAKKSGIILLYTNDCFLINQEERDRYHKLAENPIAFIPEQYVKLFDLENQENRFIPRSGLKLIFLLLKTYETVTIYGFDIDSIDGTGIQHYWGKQRSKTAHDPEMESRIIIHLINEGKVKVL